MMPALLKFSIMSEALSSVLSFLIGYYALKAYRVTEMKGMLYLNIGFTLLGAGMLFRAASSFYILLLAARGSASAAKAALRVASVAYMAAKLAAYIVLAAAYSRQPKARRAALPAFVCQPRRLTPLVYNTYLELAAIPVLTYVVAQSLMNLLYSRSRESMLVSAGFTLLLASHILALLTPLSLVFYMLSTLAQLLAFISLLAMLALVVKASD